MSPATGFLERMARGARRRFKAAVTATPAEAMRVRALAAPRSAGLRLSGTGFDLIAEVKLKAPSAGTLARPDLDVGAQARAYADAGAAAVSVLTEPERFGGSLAHLEQAAEALAGTGVPAMRKDFLVDPYQVHEARAAGAGGVLLILRLLDGRMLRAMLDAAVEHGLFVLLEAFDGEELRRARQVAHTPGLLMGLNCRNLQSLVVEPGRFAALAGQFPEGPPRVAESGLETPEDVSAVAELGYDMALVGSALMTSDAPGQTLAAMLEAGRAVRA